jgi:hypothetical protein
LLPGVVDAFRSLATHFGFFHTQSGAGTRYFSRSIFQLKTPLNVSHRGEISNGATAWASSLNGYLIQ